MNRYRLTVFLAALAPIAIYWNTLSHGFVFDDIPAIVDNPLVGSATGIQNLLQILRGPWRPIVQLSYAASHVFFGFSPVAYHTVNIALHTTNVLLVYTVAFQVARLWVPPRQHRLFATSACLIFAVHPLHSEAVAYIWGRSSSLCAFFYFGTILLVLLGHQERSAVRRRILFGCALVLGLLAWKSKEEEITLPLVLSGFLWLAGGRIAAAGTALVPVALMATRWSDLSGLAGRVAQNQELVLAGASPALPRWTFFMTEIKSVVFYYFGKFLVPVNLNVDPYVETVSRFYSFHFLAACLILACCAALATYMHRRHPTVSFSLVTLLASPLIAYAFMPLADVVAEHRAYITGLGIALLVAWAVVSRPKLGVAVLAAVVVVLSLATFERNTVWAGSETLWRDAERKSPQLARPCSAKSPSQLISLDLWVSGLHASGMKILLMLAVVQSLNLVMFAWFNRVAGLRILVLRQQLTVYKRKSKKPMLRNRDRLFWSLLSRIWRDWTSELILVRPETVIRWRKRKFREFWWRKSQGTPGRPAIANEHVDFIRRISSDHPEYGEDRIALELEVKFGIRHACSTVRRYMVKRRPGPRDPQVWRSFLKNQAQAMWSCDFLVQHTVGFRVLYVFVIMELASRKVIHLHVNDHPTLEWTKQQVRNACFEEQPKFLLHDNDGKFGQLGRAFRVERAGKRISCRSAYDEWLWQEMGIRGIPIPYGAPNAAAHIERLIGTLRRECLDRMLIWNERHLRCVLKEFVGWYNRGRVHQGLNGIPDPDPAIDGPKPLGGRLVAIPVLNGLHHDYRLAA